MINSPKIYKLEIDLIFAYHKGVHQIIEIERRYLSSNDLIFHAYKHNKIGDEYNALIHYKQIYKESGKPCNGRKYCCDVLYCCLLTDGIEQKIKEMQEEIDKWKLIESNHVKN